MRYEYVSPHEHSRLDHVGTYKRTLPVSLERMYENALDWDHLPHLHGSSFASIELLDAGAWGWRAKVGSGSSENTLELRLDRACRRWITRNLAGPNEGAEIWTHVFVTEPQQMDIVVDFFVPGVPEDAREKVGRAYAAAYELLYDEDVEMMTERQRQLDRRIDSIRSDEPVLIPMPMADALPMPISVAGRAFMLNQYHQEWVIYPAACPHQLGPLTGALNEAGEIECPWHGYRFDVSTGNCTTGSACRFGSVPRIHVLHDSDQLRIAF